LTTCSRLKGGTVFVRANRSGFLVPVVLMVMTVVGLLLFALHSLSEQQNLAAHRFTFSRVADNLAESGLDLLSTRIRESVAATGAAWSLPLADGPFFPFFLMTAEELRRRLGTHDSAAFDTMARRFFGDDWRYALDVLEGEFRGASIELSMAVEPSELYPPATGLLDPVEKRVKVVLRSRATYRGTVSTLQTAQELKVFNPLAPLTCKFSLFVSEAETGDAYNVYKNHENGLPFMGQPQAPFICYNTPPNALSDTTLTYDNIPRVDAGTPFASIDEVRQALQHRGFIYLGTRGGDIDLNLTAGESLDDNTAPTVDHEAGEFFHLYNPLTRNSEVGFFFLKNPPPFFLSTKPQPPPATDEQQPYINFLYWGFHQPSPGGNSLRADGALGESLRTEESSTLHLFGNDNEPSRTYVYGPVYQDIVRFSYLALDRDATDDDEQTQLNNYQASGAPAGYFISLRDTIDPIFRYVDTPELFADELNREASGLPFQRLQAVLPVLTNNNFFADLNGDRVRQPAEPIIDPGQATVSCDPSAYRYRTMFDGLYEGSAANEGYKNFMSLVQRVPYIEMIDYMFYCKMIPPSYHPDYRGLVAGGERDQYIEARDVALTFHNPLHDAIGATTYYDGDLPDFFYGGSQPSPAEQILRARTCETVADEAEFFELYPLHDAGAPDAPPILRFSGAVRILAGGLHLPRCVYQGSGLVVLDDPTGATLDSEGVEPLGASVLTLATLTGNVRLAGGVPQRALFVAPRGSLVHEDGKPLELGFGLAVRSLPPAALQQGGSLRYSSLVDPVSDDRSTGGYIDYYQMHLSDVFLEWSHGGGSS